MPIHGNRHVGPAVQPAGDTSPSRPTRPVQPWGKSLDGGATGAACSGRTTNPRGILPLSKDNTARRRTYFVARLNRLTWLDRSIHALPTA